MLLFLQAREQIKSEIMHCCGILHITLAIAGFLVVSCSVSVNSTKEKLNTSCRENCCSLNDLCFRYGYDRDICNHFLHTRVTDFQMNKRTDDKRSNSSRCRQTCQGYFDQCRILSNTRELHILCLYAKDRCMQQCYRKERKLQLSWNISVSYGPF